MLTTRDIQQGLRAYEQTTGKKNVDMRREFNHAVQTGVKEVPVEQVVDTFSRLSGGGDKCETSSWGKQTFKLPAVVSLKEITDKNAFLSGLDTHESWSLERVVVVDFLENTSVGKFVGLINWENDRNPTYIHTMLLHVSGGAFAKDPNFRYNVAEQKIETVTLSGGIKINNPTFITFKMYKPSTALLAKYKRALLNAHVKSVEQRQEDQHSSRVSWSRCVPLVEDRFRATVQGWTGSGGFCSIL